MSKVRATAAFERFVAIVDGVSSARAAIVRPVNSVARRYPREWTRQTGCDRPHGWRSGWGRIAIHRCRVVLSSTRVGGMRVGQGISPLSLSISIPLIGGVVAAVAYALMAWRNRRAREMRTSSNAFERTVRHRWPRPAAARSSWPAAQLVP